MTIDAAHIATLRATLAFAAELMESPRLLDIARALDDARAQGRREGIEEAAAEVDDCAASLRHFAQGIRGPDRESAAKLQVYHIAACAIRALITNKETPDAE